MNYAIHCPKIQQSVWNVLMKEKNLIGVEFKSVLIRKRKDV